MTARREIAVRVVAVIAAACLVAAFTVALLFPAAMSLGELVTTIDDRGLAAIQAFARTRLPDWTWSRLTLPLLTRPAWLLPMALGVVAVGVVVSLRSHQNAPRPRGRRG